MMMPRSHSRLERKLGKRSVCCCCCCVGGGICAVEDERERRRRKFESKRLSLKATLFGSDAKKEEILCIRGRTLVLAGEIIEDFGCVATALLEAIDAAELRRYIGGKDISDVGDRAAEFLRFLRVIRPLDEAKSKAIEVKVEVLEDIVVELVKQLLAVGHVKGWFIENWKRKRKSFRELDAALVQVMNDIGLLIDVGPLEDASDEYYPLERVAQAKLERESVLKSAAAEACARDVVFNYEMGRVYGVSPVAIVAELDYSDVRGGLDAVFGLRTVDDEPALACYFAIGSIPDLANRRPIKYRDILKKMKAAFEEEASELLVPSTIVIADDSDRFGDGIQSAKVFIYAAKGDGWDVLDDHLLLSNGCFMRRCKLESIAADLDILRRYQTISHRRPSLFVLVLEYGGRTAAERLKQAGNLDCIVWISAPLTIELGRTLLAPLTGLTVSTTEPIHRAVDRWSKKYYSVLSTMDWGVLQKSNLDEIVAGGQLLFRKEEASSVELRLRAYPKTNIDDRLFHIRCADEDRVHEASIRCRKMLSTRRRVIIRIYPENSIDGVHNRNIEAARALAAEVCGMEACRPFFDLVWRVRQFDDIGQALTSSEGSLLVWFDIKSAQIEIFFEELRKRFSEKQRIALLLTTESPLILTGWEMKQMQLTQEEDEDCEDDCTTVSSAFHTDALFIKMRDPNKTCADVADAIERDTNKSKIVAGVYRNDQHGTFVVRICIRDLVQFQYLRASLLMGGNEYKADLTRLATCFEENAVHSEPTPAQRSALASLPTEQVSIISAPAGSGKSWCAVRHVADTLVKSRSAQVLYVALTISLARIIMDRLAILLSSEEENLSRFSLLLAGQNDGDFHVVNGLDLRGGSEALHFQDGKTGRFDLVVVDEAYSIDALDLSQALVRALSQLRCHQSRFLVLLDTAMRLGTAGTSAREEEVFIETLLGTVCSSVRSARKRSLRRWRRVVRGTRRIVAASDFYRYSKYADFCAPLPLGEPVRTVIFETNRSKSLRELPSIYARHVAEAVRWLRRSYETLSLHNRLAILVPDVHFKNAMAPHLRRALEQFSVGFDLVDAAQSGDTAKKQHIETLVYDVVDEALGCEWLFALCVGLDAPLRGGTISTEIGVPEEVRWRLDNERRLGVSKLRTNSREQLATRALLARTRIYHAITRAQLAAVVVNHRLPFGWLEWLTHVTQEQKYIPSLANNATASLDEPSYRPRLHAVAEAVTVLGANIEPRLRVLRGVVALDCWNTRANSITFKHDPRDKPSTRLAFAPMSSRLLRVLRGHDGAVLSVVAIDAEKKKPMLVTCGEDATVRLWEPRTEEEDDDSFGALCVLEGHSGRVSSVAAISSTKHFLHLASGSRDGTVALWKPSIEFPLDGAPPTSRLTGHRGRVLGVVAFKLPSGEDRLATTSTDRTIRIWPSAENTSNKPLFVLDSGLVHAIVALHRQDHGVYLAGGTLQGEIRFWDVTGPGAPVRRNELSLKSHDDRVAALAVCNQIQKDAQHVLSLATGSNDHTVRVWEVLDHLSPPAPTRTYRPAPKCLVLRGHSDAIVALAAAPGPNSAVPQHAPISLASASLDKTIRLWDMQAGSALRVFSQGHSDHLTGLAFFQAHSNPVAQHDFSRSQEDGASAQHNGDASSSATATTLTISGAALSSTKRARLASVSEDATLRLWDLDND